MRGAVYCARELFVLPLMHPREGSLPERMARKHLREQVPDPALRARLTPDYRIGCKRILISDDYYPALQQPNVEVVTDSIRAITPRGIVTADGVERELDTIILGTGFHVTDMPVAELDPRRRRAHARRGMAGQPAGVPRHRRSRASPTCSCSSAPTPASATTRSCS